MDLDLGDNTAEHEQLVAGLLVASIFYVPRFAPARVVAVFGETPCQAFHPGETIVKSLPYGETSRHASHAEESHRQTCFAVRGESLGEAPDLSRTFVRFLWEMPCPP